MAGSTKKSKARKTVEDYGEGTPVITRVVTKPGEIIKPAGHPLLQAGIAYQQARGRGAPGTEQEETFKALQRQRVSIAFLKRQHSSLKTRAWAIREMEKSGWPLSPGWEQIKWRAFLDESWLKRLDKWNPNDEKEGRKLAAFLVKMIRESLDANPEFAEPIVSHWKLISSEFFRFVAFLKFGVEGGDVWRVYRDRCFVRKPKGYLKFVREPGFENELESKVLQKSDGKGYLAAGDSVTEAHRSLSNKQGWDLLKKWEMLEGFIMSLWQQKIALGDVPRTVQERQERRLTFRGSMDDPGETVSVSFLAEPPTRKLKVWKPDPDFGPPEQLPDELVAMKQSREIMEEIKTYLTPKLLHTFGIFLENPRAKDTEIALILHCRPDTINPRRKQIHDRLPLRLQRALKELLS